MKQKKLLALLTSTVSMGISTFPYSCSAMKPIKQLTSTNKMTVKKYNAHTKYFVSKNLKSLDDAYVSFKYWPKDIHTHSVKLEATNRTVREETTSNTTENSSNDWLESEVGNSGLCYIIAFMKRFAREHNMVLYKFSETPSFMMALSKDDWNELKNKELIKEPSTVSAKKVCKKQSLQKFNYTEEDAKKISNYVELIETDKYGIPLRK